MSGSKILCPGKRVLVAKSCTVCGQLRDARFFSMNTRGYRLPECKICHSRRSKAVMNATNRESASTATKGRLNRWTEGDTQKLREFVAAGMTATEIAPKLGRSIYAVEMKKGRIGLRTPLVEVEPPDAEEDELEKLVPVTRKGVTIWVRAS